MPDYGTTSIPARDGTLGIISGLAQGVQQGLQSYQQQRMANAELQMKQQQAQSEAALRNMQMQKMQQDMAPLNFDAAKLHLLMHADDAGYEVPGSVIKEQWQKTLGQIDNPQKLQAAKQFLTQKQSALTTQMSGDQFSEMYGSDARLGAPQPAQGGSSTVSMQPAQLAEGGAVPTMNGGVQMGDQSATPHALPTRMPVGQNQQVSQAAVQPSPTSFSMTPNEAKMYESVAKTTTDARLGAMAAQGRSDNTYASMLNNLTTNANNLARTTDTNQAREGIAQLQAHLKEMQSLLDSQTKKDVAGTNADARVKSALIRGPSRGAGAKANPELASVDAMIKQSSKALDDSNKPPTGFSMELPSDAAARKAAAQQRVQQLVQVRDYVSKGMSINAAMMAVQQKSGAPVALPPAGAGGNAPSGKIPTFQSGPGTSAQIAKLPDGSKFKVGEQVFLYKGGKAIPSEE